MNKDYFRGTGFDNQGVHSVTPTEALKLCKEGGAIIIDVRENYHSFLHTFDVPDIYYCPLSEIKEHLDKMPGDQPVIFADASGMKSIEAVKILQENGFKNVANLAGGMLEWNREQMPVISDNTRRLSGSCMCMLKYREIKMPNLPDIKPEI